MHRPAWIAFDLNGTLLDPAALVAEAPELGRAALDEALIQSMADTVTGHYRPFPDYLRAALDRRLKVAGIDGALDSAMERAGRFSWER